MSNLQQRCNDILNDSDIDEDVKIDKVEELVTKEHPDTPSSSVERLVLDILWRHRQGKTDVKSIPRIISGADQGIKLQIDRPLPSDLSKLEKLKSAAPPPNEISTTFSEIEQETASPFDILRESLGWNTSDEEIQKCLEKNEYDILATLDILTNRADAPSNTLNDFESPASHASKYEDRGKVMCKYFVQYGECLRADCFYSHDLSGRICRFWLQGSCLAGDNCPFLHNIPLENLAIASEDLVDPVANVPPSFKEDDFPVLGAPRKKNNAKSKQTPKTINDQNFGKSHSAWDLGSSPKSKSVVAVAKLKPIKLTPKIKVDLVRPRHIPWSDLKYGINAQYIAHRQAAAKHSEMRNKYLQLATDNWSRNNSAQAAKLSKKGQSHNATMAEEYSLGAELLLDQSKLPGSELFLDLHGLAMEDALALVKEQLLNCERDKITAPRPLYLILDTGKSSRMTGEERIMMAVKQFCDRSGYEYADFGSDSKFGKIIGIDPWSHR